MTPILYSFCRCPYAMRARLALVSSGIQVEMREILLRDKPAEMVDASAKATVPVLISDGQVIDESRDIMDWSLAQNDPEGWLVNVNIPLIETCETTFKDALDRYKYTTRYEGVSQITERAIASVFLRDLEEILTNQPFLSGENIGYTDMAIVTFIRQFANVDRDWFDSQSWENLHNWLEDFLKSDRFAFIMQKFPVWHANNPPIFFPETK